jgi:hypothetical protein
VEELELNEEIPENLTKEESKKWILDKESYLKKVFV